MSKKTITLNLEKYLTPKDFEQFKELKRIVRFSYDLEEIIRCHEKARYLVKKAYVRYQLEQNSLL